ncbi:unnamed protein product [Thelazia callipaeda]|uniref:PDZ domain-containing protein n=1 Tax=Thelazia callipaeda TaxID=103827 RepID=A0A0N5D5P3_THECL|nr:unnamed protein product [Thelazia callipaeda]
MTSCTSLATRFLENSDDHSVENLKNYPEQQSHFLKSQPTYNDLSSNSSINILKDVVRCMLDKDTSALGFHISQRSDGICISHVEPNGPAHRSGNIFVGDKIKELTIAFENMPITDALTILSCASTYKVLLCTTLATRSKAIQLTLQIRLELERSLVDETIEPDHPEFAKCHKVSVVDECQFSSLLKSHSTSDLTKRFQKAQIPAKIANGGSFMSKQKYQLPRRSSQNLAPEALVESMNSESSRGCKAYSQSTTASEPAVAVQNCVISEETIVITDEYSGTSPSTLQTVQTSQSEVFPDLKIQSNKFASNESLQVLKNISNPSTPENSPRQSTTRIPSPRSKRPPLSLAPKEDEKIDQIKQNECSKFEKQSESIYSNASIKDAMQKSHMEFCELIEPKIETIATEFEENNAGNKSEEDDQNSFLNCLKYNGIHDVESNQTDSEQNNSDFINCNISVGASLSIDTDQTSDHKSATGSELTLQEAVTQQDSNRVAMTPVVSPVVPPIVPPRSIDDPQYKNGTFSPEIQSSSNRLESSEIPFVANRVNKNELISSTHSVLNERLLIKSPVVPPRSTSQNSPNRSRLQKMSANYSAIEESIAEKDSKKLNGISVVETKDEGFIKSNKPQRIFYQIQNGIVGNCRNPKWSPKLQSHIPVVTRTPSTKSRKKFTKAEHIKVTENPPVPPALNKISDDVFKSDMNGASLYIAKKEALRKTYLPHSKISREEEIDLNKTRRARLEANQALLQRQQDELRALGILP